VATTRLNEGKLERLWRYLRWLPTLALLIPWLLSPRIPSVEARIRDLAGPTSFGLLDWEIVRLVERAPRIWEGLFAVRTPDTTDTEMLNWYFQADRAARDRLRPAAEVAIERAVARAYAAAGAGSEQPLLQERLFPPVLVALTPPPNVLVISPRAELRVAQTVLLKQVPLGLRPELERSADSTGVSSLVAPIGGIGTYPSMAPEDDAPRQLITTVAHEWLHHYLVFFPLGAGYWSSQETREINETTADLVAAEIGERVIADLGLALPPSASPTPQAFDFRAFMRATRLEVERLLEHQQVERAEAYMRERRDELEQQGFYIRKLNQAFFAFYGSYGDGFAASPRSPVPELLRRLRAQSPTLGTFLQRIRTITTVEQLRAAVAR
jgi:hypothetical protein